MSLDPLEQRLTQLELETPDPGRISARALTTRRKARRAKLIRVPAVGLGVIALAVAVLYFVPATAAVLAGTPIGGDLLREAGLAGAAGRVTAVGAMADSSGFRLTLVGAYADSTRTVLLMRSSPAITPDAQAVLTDQFGRTDPMQSGYADARTGDLILQFDPLGWPNSVIGARLTLHISQVKSFYYDASASDWKVGPPVAGDWTTRATLGVDEGASLVAPSAGQVGGAECTFGAARSSDATIVVDIYMHGVTPAQLDTRIPDGGKGRAVFDVSLVDPNGDQSPDGYRLSPSSDGTIVQLIAFRSIAGNYQLRVTYQGGELDRVLRVP